MAETVSIKSILSQTTSDGKKYDPISKLGVIGALFGILAGVVGLVMGGVNSLLPVPSLGETVLKTPSYFLLSAAFMGLLSLGVLLQAIGSKDLRAQLASPFTSVIFVTAILGIVMAALLPVGGFFWNTTAQSEAFVYDVAILSAIFLIAWQMTAVIYVDSTNSWIGFLAGITNGLAIPIIAIGQALGGGILLVGYLILIVSQLFAMLYWRAPFKIIRPYARSPERAKFAFGLSGLLTFLVGTVAIFFGPLTQIGGVDVFQPWSSYMTDEGFIWTINDPDLEPVFLYFITNPALIFALCGMLLFWIMQSPRLGAKELKATHIGEDLVKGGVKWLMIFFAMFGIVSAGIAGTQLTEVAPGAALFLTLCPAAVMFLMGGIYAENTDIITGLPLVVTSILLMVHPYALSWVIIVPWILVIITQGLLMVETKTRGFTAYSQRFLTVIVTLGSSALFVMFLLGVFGSGPSAIWPTNRWYNVTLFGDSIPTAIQAPVVLVLPMLALLVRNVALTGYAHGRKQVSAGVLGGISVLFVMMIPIIALNFDIAHQALTAAAILLAFYTISFILVLSLNLNLAGSVEDKGHMLEGQIIRATTIVGIAIGAVIALFAMATFSGFPDASQIALAITLLVILITGLEILMFIGWLSIGVRLGMIKEGFSFTRREEAMQKIPTDVPEVEDLR